MNEVDPWEISRAEAKRQSSTSKIPFYHRKVDKWTHLY